MNRAALWTTTTRQLLLFENRFVEPKNLASFLVLLYALEKELTPQKYEYSH